jgi:osmotically-inducible protein OsmY
MKLSPWVLDANASVSRAVEDELSWAPDVPSGLIRTSVDDGVVTLSGTVHNCAERRSALEAALGILGVQAVVDDLSIAPRDGAQHTDAEIHRAVQAALRWNCALTFDPIRATVREKVVTLAGEVMWNFQREEAIRCIEHIRGIVSVDSQLSLRARVAAPDTAERIAEALERNAFVRTPDVTVIMHGTEATLSGTVRTWQEKREAERVAWSSPHVEFVNDQLKVSADYGA